MIALRGTSVDTGPGGPAVLTREEAFALAGLVVLFAATTAWWALAFWPLDDVDGLVARTRWVCFGVAGNGLPDAAGWIGLVAAPLGMLAILLTGWGSAVGAVLRRARRSPPVGGTLLLMALALLVVVGNASLRVRQAAAAETGFRDVGARLPAPSHPRLDRPAPPFELVAHDGRTVSLESFAGRPVLLTFAYAHCATVCPVIVRNVLRARDRLDEEGDVDAVVLVVTLDPWRDTPSRLPAMAQRWALPGDAWVLGGDVDVVESMLDAWQVPRSRDLATGEVVHPSLVYVVAPDGRIAFASTGDDDVLVRLVGRL